MKRLILILLCHGLTFGMAMGQEWGDELHAAAADNDTASLTRLVQQHRLDVKPEVEALITDALRQDRKRARRRLLRDAERIGAAFEATHGEKSLSWRAAFAANLAESDWNTKLRADSLYAEAVARRGQADQRENVREQLLAAADLYRSIEDTAGLAETLGQLGYVSWFLDRPAYLTYNEEALALRREIDDRQLVGNTLNDLGLFHRAIERDFQKALDVYLESESVRWAIGDSLALSRTIPNIALSYEGLGNYEKALEYYQKGANLYLAVGDTARYIGQRNNAAGVLTDVLERHSDALVEMLRLREELKAINDPRTEALVTNSIGVVSRRLGDFEGAIRNYQDVIALSEEHGFDDLLAGAFNNIGVVYIWIGRAERAAPYFERARQRYEEAGDASGLMNTLINLGSAAYETKQYDSSVDWMLRADSVAAGLNATLSRATIQTGLGNGRLWTEGPEAAEGHYMEALAIARDFEIPDLEMGALFGLGDAAERAERPEKALEWYHEAVSSLESARGMQRAEEDKAGYLAQMRYLFEDVVDFLSREAIASGEPEWVRESFDFAERAKARAFVDQLAEAIADVNQGVDATLLEDQQVLTDNLVWLRNELAAEEDADRRKELKDLVREQEMEFDRVERELRATNTAYADLRYPEPIGLDALRALLGPDEVALSYSLGDSSSTLWAVSASGVSVHLLPTRSELSTPVELLRFGLQDPTRLDAAAYSDAAHALYATLVEPAADMLAGADKVVILPDDILHYVPFEALVSEGGSDWTTMEYFGRTADVSYAPSATVLSQLRSRERLVASRDFLAVGNPDFTETNTLSNLRGNALAPLPFTAEEVSSIATLFDPNEVDILTGPSATESRIRETVMGNDYRFVHFATHGLINDDRPDYSALALSVGDTPGEGLLQAGEIFNLPFHAELVVLSACETGLGQLIQGEGMVGLTRAFMYAGASSLVVSLWSVSDSSTSDLMSRFYRHMVRDGMSKGAALRQAKTELMGEAATAHPFHWAPFVLTGAAN